jgi:hypothetical protein
MNHGPSRSTIAVNSLRMTYSTAQWDRPSFFVACRPRGEAPSPRPVLARLEQHAQHFLRPAPSDYCDRSPPSTPLPSRPESDSSPPRSQAEAPSCR